MSLLRNCLECGKLFEFVLLPRCPECVEQEARELQLIKDYLQDHPSMGIGDIHQATGVSLKAILRMQKEGTLTSASNGKNPGPAHGAPCGNPVTQGSSPPDCCRDASGSLDRAARTKGEAGNRPVAGGGSRARRTDSSGRTHFAKRFTR